MMSFKSNFVVKCVAVILFAVFMTTTLLSGACIVFGLASGTFTSETELAANRDNLMTDTLWQYERRIRDSLKGYANYGEKNGEPYEYYVPDIPENILYEIKDSNNKIIYSTIDETAGDVSVSFHPSFSVLKEEYENKNYTVEEVYEESSTGVHIDNSMEPMSEIHANTNMYYEEKVYDVTIQLKENITVKDNVYYLGILFDFVAKNETKLFATAVISVIMFVVLFIFLMCASGHKSGVKGINISRFDAFPIDILTAVYGGLTVLLAFAIVAVVDTLGWGQYDDIYYIIFPYLLVLLVLGIVLDFVLLAVLSMTTAVRLKTKTFIKTSLIYLVLNFLFKFVKWIWNKIVINSKKLFSFIGRMLRKIPLVWKTVVGVATIIFIHFILLAYDWGEIWPASFILTTILGIAIILVAILMKDIKKSTEEIANGNVYKKIDTKYLFLDLKDHAENINNMSDGIAKAVAEQMKSERFKTELITNVSHDIKTPLTSIINYVDLLEKEEIENETAKEYVGVLSRQSARLKKLIEDLLEASKASTGNINVNLLKFELGILLSQALGEYEERFAQNNLQVVLNKTDEMLLVMADNRHMWRVFDNILNNIAKYAQPGTRVYIDAIKKNNHAEISFRNISKDPLNISGNELMERFVRGDSSRNTEGSGLGLSIAKSLTEVQKGNLDIQIDGDLFKVRLSFSLSE